MTPSRRRRSLSHGCAAAALIALSSGCAALPRSGPLASQITTAEQPDDLEGLVAPLTADVVTRANRPDPRGFPPALRNGAVIDPELVGVGDLLDIAIWESGEIGLISGAAAGVARLESTAVDSEGRIYVPYAGAQRAAGSSLTVLRDRIARALEPFTPLPQVDVRMREPLSRTVTIQGAVGKPGPYTIDRRSARLSAMLALAGGATLPPERVEVILRRDGVDNIEILDRLLRDPALDVALAPQDMLVLAPIRERFVVLGAASLQAELAFPTRPFDLLSAIGVARGLSDLDADPTGVFLFRRESDGVADALLRGPAPAGLPEGSGRPIVYQLDLTRPEALFVARAFEMRDGDAIFVTNAPLTELRKFFQLFNTAIGSVAVTQRVTPID